VESLCATFPRLRGDERDAVRRLAADGPPEEEVGLAPYPMDLPMPSLPGAS
jgi:nitrate reductase molybdenum cofactor assembly chaperone NarJ/NarW